MRLTPSRISSAGCESRKIDKDYGRLAGTFDLDVDFVPGHDVEAQRKPIRCRKGMARQLRRRLLPGMPKRQLFPHRCSWLTHRGVTAARASPGRRVLNLCNVIHPPSLGTIKGWSSFSSRVQ